MSSSIINNYDAYMASQRYLLFCGRLDFPLDVLPLVERCAFVQTKSDYLDYCAGAGLRPSLHVGDAVTFFIPKETNILLFMTKKRARSVFASRSRMSLGI